MSGQDSAWGNDTNSGAGVRGKENKNPTNKSVSGTSTFISLAMPCSKASEGSDRDGDVQG